MTTLGALLSLGWVVFAIMSSTANLAHRHGGLAALFGSMLTGAMWLAAGALLHAWWLS